MSLYMYKKIHTIPGQMCPEAKKIKILKKKWVFGHEQIFGTNMSNLSKFSINKEKIDEQ